MEHTENQIVIRGNLTESPIYSHENHGRQFVKFCLRVERLSGNADVLPVIAPENMISDLPLTPGATVRATGQIRSHNLKNEEGRHLKIFLFASEVCGEEGEPINEVTVCGNLCREPVLRRTPLGREICDVMLAVPRAFRRADYLPCILWGRTAQDAACCRTGDCITISGRLQSRNYTKQTDTGPETRTAYEISAMSAVIPTDLY